MYVGIVHVFLKEELASAKGKQFCVISNKCYLKHSYTTKELKNN